MSVEVSMPLCREVAYVQRYVHSTGEVNEEGREVTMALLQEKEPETMEEWETVVKADMYPGMSEEEILTAQLWQNCFAEAREAREHEIIAAKSYPVEEAFRIINEIECEAMHMFVERGGDRDVFVKMFIQ